MRRPGARSMHRLASFRRRLGGRSGKDALLLALLVTATSGVVLLGVGLQLPSASQADGARVREVEALLMSIRQSTARCTSAQSDKDRQTQRDATLSAGE